MSHFRSLPLLHKISLFELQLILILFSVWNSTDLCDFPKELIKKYPAVTGLSSCHPEWNSMGKNKDNHANIQNKVLKQDIMLAVLLKTDMALVCILLYSLPYHQISSHFTHFRGKIFFDDFFCLMGFFVSCYQIKKPPNNSKQENNPQTKQNKK